MVLSVEVKRRPVFPVGAIGPGVYSYFLITDLRGNKAPFDHKKQMLNPLSNFRLGLVRDSALIVQSTYGIYTNHPLICKQKSLV